MKLNKIDIHNFKCFEDVSFGLHPRLNVLMGNNGTGKSSLLEAFRILIGSLYLGYDKYENQPYLCKGFNRTSELRRILVAGQHDVCCYHHSLVDTRKKMS